MPARENLTRLVALSAPYWAAEAEVVQTYFDSPARTRETDIVWLRRQCFKELWGSGVGDRDKGLFQWQAAYLAKVFDGIDRTVDRHVVLGAIDDLRTEFAHYCLFADVHDSLSGSKLTPFELQGWPADDELARLRYACRQESGVLGDLMVGATEGGNGAMYAVGMRLSGKGEVNDRIARACEQVYADEIGHTRRGLISLSQRHLSAGEWARVGSAIPMILRQRLQMRNEQFGSPVPRTRMRELEAGGAAPIPFDYSGVDEMGGEGESR